MKIHYKLRYNFSINIFADVGDIIRGLNYQNIRKEKRLANFLKNRHTQTSIRSKVNGKAQHIHVLTRRSDRSWK